MTPWIFGLIGAAVGVVIGVFLRRGEARGEAGRAPHERMAHVAPQVAQPQPLLQDIARIKQDIPGLKQDIKELLAALAMQREKEGYVDARGGALRSPSARSAGARSATPVPAGTAPTEARWPEQLEELHAHIGDVLQQQRATAARVEDIIRELGNVQAIVRERLGSSGSADVTRAPPSQPRRSTPVAEEDAQNAERATTLRSDRMAQLVARWNALDWDDRADQLRRLNAELKHGYRFTEPFLDQFCLLYREAADVTEPDHHLFPRLGLAATYYHADFFDRPSAASATKLIRPAKVRLAHQGSLRDELAKLNHREIGLSALALVEKGELA